MLKKLITLILDPTIHHKKSALTKEYAKILATYLGLFFALLVINPSPLKGAASDIKIKTITIYTYDSFSGPYGAGPKIKDLFEKSCNCKIKYLSLSDANLILSKIILENKKTSADIILGIDNHLLQKANQTHLFSPHNISLPLSDFNPPDDYFSDLFLPFDYGWFTFVYSNKTLPNPPKNFAELLNIGNNKSRSLVIQDPRTSSPGLGFLVWLSTLYPNNLGQVLKKIDQQVISYPKGWSQAYQMFLAGEAKMVFSYITSPIYHQLMEKRFDIKPWVSGDDYYMQIEYAAILKTSKQPKLAKEFLKFLVSEPAQKLIATTQWMYPVINVPLPKAFGLAKPKNIIWPKVLTQQEYKKLIGQWLNATN
ncbi:MAG: thiamine ABC transporter substrate-binding protein [SAR324 cluster bacterium]|nr:thiamine ABC transporter substrate-binding protein [SAR324 cluster bacterium]